MELPPSGWYPDPYGVTGLLRWWDGSTWTHHTHASGGTAATDGAEPGAQAGAAQTTVQPAAQPGVQPGVQPMAGQPRLPPTTMQPTTMQPTTVQPAVRPAAYQPAVTAVQATTVQPAVQPTQVQPTTVQPAVQPTTGQPGGAAPQGSDDNGTAVLFLGDDAWAAPGADGGPGALGVFGGPGGPGGSGGPGGPGQPRDRYGYYRAQRRRRMWLTGGLAGGTAVALGAVALVVYSLGNSHTTAPPAKAATRPAVVKTTLRASSPAATPSPTQTLPPITDGTSGLSYAELPSPWQPSCPSGLSQGFSWTAGESAIAGQINGGQTTWYGDACSAPLPQQYGYNGVADLESVTASLVNQFVGQYYSGLAHGFQQEVSQPITVSGHAGWEIKYLITYQNAQGQGLGFTDEEGAVVVADLGPGVAPAVFFASIPSNLGEANVDRLVSSLQLTVPPQPGSGGSPGAGSPGAGSPGPGGPGGSPGNGNGNGGGNGNGRGH